MIQRANIVSSVGIRLINNDIQKTHSVSQLNTCISTLKNTSGFTPPVLHKKPRIRPGLNRVFSGVSQDVASQSQGERIFVVRASKFNAEITLVSCAAYEEVDEYEKVDEYEEVSEDEARRIIYESRSGLATQGQMLKKGMSILISDMFTPQLKKKASVGAAEFSGARVTRVGDKPEENSLSVSQSGDNKITDNVVSSAMTDKSPGQMNLANGHVSRLVNTFDHVPLDPPQHKTQAPFAAVEYRGAHVSRVGDKPEENSLSVSESGDNKITDNVVSSEMTDRQQELLHLKNGRTDRLIQLYNRGSKAAVAGRGILKSAPRASTTLHVTFGSVREIPDRRIKIEFDL